MGCLTLFAGFFASVTFSDAVTPRSRRLCVPEAISCTRSRHHNASAIAQHDPPAQGYC